MQMDAGAACNFFCIHLHAIGHVMQLFLHPFACHPTPLDTSKKKLHAAGELHAHQIDLLQYCTL
jgi:hypothetical protein